ncbi:putative nuclease HARBI1 [Anopheles cruzii]|uniref:putative nuclease HARBI1 n=1 Tax=Anopheles cruzii TaxID=68878 RepID=UPI0022EC718D|nr:putative nuclease HARBI1 [Anopheles cruzii]
MISAYYVFDSDSDSDSDGEETANIRIQRQILRVKSDPLNLSSSAFKKSFRISKEMFLTILSEIEAKFPPLKGAGLTPKEKLAATLRFLAEGRHGVGQDWNVAIAQSTFSPLFRQTLKILEETQCPKRIKLEMDASEQKEARQYFYEQSGIPDIVVCADGTHIKLIAPKDNRDQYCNERGFCSLNVLMICDHTMTIRYVNARYSGANDAADIWVASGVDKFFAEKYGSGNRDFKVLVDSAYPSKPWIVTPKRNATINSPEAVHNNRHAKARHIIERSFGLLKNRFRCLLAANQLHYTPEIVGRITNVCCALHNYCISENMTDQ